MKKKFVLIVFFILNQSIHNKIKPMIKYKFGHIFMDLDLLVNYRYKKMQKGKYAINTICTITDSDLSGSNREYEPLEGVTFENCKCIKTFFTGADLSYSEFPNSDLTGADFSKALFSSTTKFENAKSVKKANFKNSIGLSNKQKQFLRKNGAINVPRDLTNGEELRESCKGMLGLVLIGGTCYGLLYLMSN